MTHAPRPEWNQLRPGELAVTAPQSADATLQFIGRISTPWAGPLDCPKRGDEENGPICFIRLQPCWVPALQGLLPKDRLQVLYWLHLSRRDLLRQTPRSHGQARGTFALRSPLRPNPIASSYVRLVDMNGADLSVRGLDCVDGTPLLDIKPAFGACQATAG